MKQKKGYWDNTIEKALKTGKFSLTAKKFAGRWNHCSVGEKLNFPIARTDEEMWELEPQDAFLDNIGIQFADSVSEDDPITAKMIHELIKSYDESKPEYAIHYLYTTGLMDRYNILKQSEGRRYYLDIAIRVAKDRHEINQENQKALGQTNSGN